MTVRGGQDIAADVRLVDALQRRLVTLRQHLALGLPGEELAGSGVELLTCRVGAEMVALPVPCVEMLVMRCALTPLPGARPWVAGLLDFRGDPLPVLDVQGYLLGRVSPVALSDVLVVCRGAGRRGALLVQGVDALWAEGEVEVRDEVHDVPHADSVVGTARVGDGQALVLGVGSLLTALAQQEAR